MSTAINQWGELIKGMRAAYSRGENVMAYARKYIDGTLDSGSMLRATLIAYDLQAGVYINDARADPALQHAWCSQIAALIRRSLPQSGTLLEAGVGEATTLAGVLEGLGRQVGIAYGFDISWSRVMAGHRWLAEKQQHAELFVADLFHMPLADDSVDVVYTSHSLEPNAGREEAAIAECLRVARHSVVLIEPIYELASSEAQARMRHHGYVRGLRETAIRLGATIVDYKLLERCHNPLNPSGVLMLRKPRLAGKPSESERESRLWRCPITGAGLQQKADCYVAADVGIAYPILRGVPLLRPEHAVIASKLSNDESSH